MKRVSVLALLAVMLAFFFCGQAMPQETWYQHPDGIFRRSCPPAISPSPVLLVGDRHVVQQPSRSEWIEQPCSPAPHTVLDQLPGTGSKLPTIGGKQEISHKLDPETLAKLKELLATKLPTPTVNISPPIGEETTQRLSRIAMMLEMLLALGSVMLGGSAVGKVLPLVAPLLRGLLRLSEGESRASNPTQEAPSSTALSGSSAVSPAAPSSTQKPNS